MVWLSDERRSALFPAGTIVRDLHHRESHRSSDNHCTTAPLHHDVLAGVVLGYKESFDSTLSAMMS